MPPILNAQEVSKSFGADPLLRNIAFTVEERARIGLIGPNGSGKSTLLGILGGDIDPDSGEVTVRKRTRLSYVAQQSEFTPGTTVRAVLEASLERIAAPAAEWEGRIGETLGRTGFVDFAVDASTLSGGWRKRLAIAEALVQAPDVLLLDEPTNHLDLSGIEWLEGLLNTASFACVVVSHDRYFLENVCTETVELNRAYPDGLLRVNGNYSEFLIKKEAFLEAQAKRQDALSNRVRTEIDWLRRGPKARTTKSKARIDKAHELIGELAEVSARIAPRQRLLNFLPPTGRPNDWLNWKTWSMASLGASFSPALILLLPPERASAWWAPMAAVRQRCCGYCGARSNPAKVPSNGRLRCAPFTSIRIAFWSRTSLCGGPWPPIAIQ